MSEEETLERHECFKLISPDEDLQERCDHEAGHFVMLHSLGVEHWPRFLSVLPHASSRAGGICYFTLEKDLDLGGATFQFLGGMVAQLIGIQNRYNVPLSNQSMREHVRRAEIGGGADILALQEKYGVDDDYVYGHLGIVRDRVENFWRYIVAVSAELKDRGILYHEEPRMIVNATKSNEPGHHRLISKYRIWRRPANPADYDCASFLELYPDRPFYETAMETLSRFARG